jgi:ABC-type multidrug transport system permease subunit
MASSHDFLDPQLWYILPLLLLLAGVSYLYDLTFITLFALNKERWWLKRELLALLIGLSIGALSLLSLPTAAKVVLIISSAIAAEAAMALMGFQKLHKELRA